MKKAGYYVLLALGVGVAGYFTIQSVFPQDEEVVMYGEVDEARTKRASLQSMSCSATNAGTLRYSNGCFQYCDGKGVWINKGAGCDASSHTISCIGLPVANASWNTTSSITQTRNGDEWLPTAIGSYNTTASDNECRFTCNENYTYSGGDNTCIINTSTLTINPGGSTYIQDIGTTKSVSAPAGGSYIVSYNLNGGESTIPESSTSTQQFSGWTLTGGGNVLSTTTNPTTYTFGASNGMLTANYGNYPAITCPAAPIKAGYTFNGWYTAASQGTKRCDASTTYTPAQNETLYAQWSIACTVNSLGIWVSSSYTSQGYGSDQMPLNGSISLQTTVNATPSGCYTWPYAWTITAGGGTLTPNGSSTNFTSPSSYGQATIQISAGGKTATKTIMYDDICTFSTLSYTYPATLARGSTSAYYNVTLLSPNCPSSQYYMSMVWEINNPWNCAGDATALVSVWRNDPDTGTEGRYSQIWGSADFLQGTTFTYRLRHNTDWMGGEKTGKVAIYLDVRSKSKNNLFSTLFDPGTKNIRRCGGGFPTVII